MRRENVEIRQWESVKIIKEWDCVNEKMSWWEKKTGKCEYMKMKIWENEYK